MHQPLSLSLSHTHTNSPPTDRGLVPLHNACSYGHYEVAEQLAQHMTNVNVVDLWKFTPLHEAAAKGKYEICKLLLKVKTKHIECVCVAVAVQSYVVDLLPCLAFLPH